VQQAHQGLVKTLRADLHRWLPELDAAQGELADAIELVTSFEAWDRLRNDQRRAAAEVHDAEHGTDRLVHRRDEVRA